MKTHFSNRSYFIILIALLLITALALNPANSQNTKKVDSCKAILFFGNSLTAAYGLDKSQAFPNLVQEKIDELSWKFEVVNAGLSGETSAGGLRRINWLLRRKIDVFILELGANDALRGIDLDLTKHNLQGIIDKVQAKYPAAEIVIAGMQAPPNLGGDYTHRFREIFYELAKENKVHLIPFLLADVAGVPELNLADRIHPNVKGHKVVAENVWAVLKPVLAELSRV